MVIDIPASSDACKVKPKRTICEVVKIESLSDHRIRLSVKSRDGELPMFLPGQYVNITAPDEGISRPYSFTSAPGSDVATFLIRNLPNGRMSLFLKARAKQGERLILDGPFGNFYLRAPTRPVLFVAAGTGVGPFLSMLEHLAMTGNRDQPVRLIYGARDRADLVELERIEALRALLPDFSYVTTCSNPASEHQLSGRVTDHLSAEALNHGDVDVYLCGPPEMVESGRQHAAKCGLPAANIHFEKFAPAAASATTLHQA